jgi:hypothetical protein
MPKKKTPTMTADETRKRAALLIRDASLDDEELHIR